MMIIIQEFIKEKIKIQIKTNPQENELDILEKLKGNLYFEYFSLMSKLNEIQILKLSHYPKLDEYDYPFCNIVFLGKTGVGKTSLINTLVGENVFNTENIFDSDTIHCNFHDISYKNGTQKILRFVDTIGLLDTILENKTIILNKAYVKRIEIINYFVLVIQKGRLLKDEKEGIKTFLDNIDHEIIKNIIICVTHCNKFDKNLSTKKIKENNFLCRYLKKDFSNLFFL